MVRILVMDFQILTVGGASSSEAFHISGAKYYFCIVHRWLTCLQTQLLKPKEKIYRVVILLRRSTISLYLLEPRFKEN